MVTVIPSASISPQKIVFYEYLDGIRRGGSTSEASRRNLEDNSTKGDISSSAQKRIRSAVNWLYALSPWQTHHIADIGKTIRFRLNLITLTLSSKQVHTDLEIKKKLLNPFLERLRKQYGLKSYIWRAEPQKNGNIHFHITTNCYIHYLECRSIWNEIQNNLGYIDRYMAGGGDPNPNSTDIHAVRNVRKLASYISEYLCKKNEGREIEGRQWFLSTNLSKLRPAYIIRDSFFQQEVYEFVKETKAKYFLGEHATVLFACVFSHDLKKYPQLRKVREDLLTQYQHTVWN